MEDYVTVVRAIWKSFSDGSPLNIRTASYTIDRLQPFFNPGPLTHDAPRILLGGVNPRAIELAGRGADWFVTHPTNSHPRFVRERVSPVIDGAKRTIADPLRIITASPLITGPTPTDVDRSRESQRAVLAFLFSTPAYQRSLEMFGWPDLGPRLRGMTRAGDWSSLATLMSDDVLDTLLPTGTWDVMPDILNEWYSGLVDGLLVQPPEDPEHDHRFRTILERIADIEPRSN
jgi:alkanesulfonate monooxygenase SsuD/methylene tetrahydromethanopterin reductase-like flavin-dependent oxidoreductase (luciferase family)